MFKVRSYYTVRQEHAKSYSTECFHSSFNSMFLTCADIVTQLRPDL